MKVACLQLRMQIRCPLLTFLCSNLSGVQALLHAVNLPVRASLRPPGRLSSFHNLRFQGAAPAYLLGQL